MSYFFVTILLVCLAIQCFSLVQKKRISQKISGKNNPDEPGQPTEMIINVFCDLPDLTDIYTLDNKSVAIYNGNFSTVPPTTIPTMSSGTFIFGTRITAEAKTLRMNGTYTYYLPNGWYFSMSFFAIPNEWGLDSSYEGTDAFFMMDAIDTTSSISILIRPIPNPTNIITTQ